ncbi:MAG: hypothetical protein PUC88_00640 [Clostridia bacterium]|nr:hypothetical protein [Clostridia bacterium]
MADFSSAVCSSSSADLLSRSNTFFNFSGSGIIAEAFSRTDRPSLQIKKIIVISLIGIASGKILCTITLTPTIR